MKLFILVIFFFTSVAVFSQQTITAEFEVVFSSLTRLNIQIYQREDQLASKLVTRDMAEYIVIDKAQKKMLELMSVTGPEEFSEAQEYLWKSKFPSYGMSMVFMYIVKKQLNTDQYRLLPEKKELFGRECRKIELLNEDPDLQGTGWVMTGVQLELTEEIGWMRVKEGTIVEMNYSSGGFFLKDLDLTADQEHFSFEVPEGYRLLKQTETEDDLPVNPTEE